MVNKKTEVQELKARLETLESYLGVFYTVDSDGFKEYRTDGEDSWSFVPKTNKSIEDLKKAAKKEDK